MAAHVVRLPQINLAAVLVEQNPHIDLKLHNYENSTRNFLKALTNYKNRAISTIADRRKYQSTEKKKVLEKTQLVETETNQCKLREIELVAELEREKQERKDAELSVAAFKRQLASLREKCSSIEVEIEHYRAVTENLRREKDKERSVLSTHASHVSPELLSCEQRLSCFVEGIQKDRLLVRFQHIDRYDSGREATFVLDVSTRLYKVITSSPHLPTLPLLVDALNDSGDIFDFIRQVRKGYGELVTKVTQSIAS
ncbi:chromosome segregation protein Spc25-domain-containing protein [Crucibulum laeve]|uniref:Kinetochore protein SPC25 n=1 Tax=Crucibulum laeve TaxID=68775 RepID=A0A5C3M0H9_9AGAR|nr:chromosome segregation protein Spc25-domain-containing protein [Crucibulum laeve]